SSPPPASSAARATMSSSISRKPSDCAASSAASCAPAPSSLEMHTALHAMAANTMRPGGRSQSRRRRPPARAALCRLRLERELGAVARHHDRIGCAAELLPARGRVLEHCVELVVDVLRVVVEEEQPARLAAAREPDRVGY